MKALFEKHQIERRIHEIALQIENRHKHEHIPIVLVCVLNGGFMFYTKLAEQLQSLDPECDFIKVKSYEGKERGNLEILLHSTIDVNDKHVYIIDDIYDSGVTMKSLREYYLNKGAINASVVTLIKRAINEIDMPLNSLYGFEIHDEWVVGYGMDDEEGKKRSIPYILAIK
jgi:hypoxanthine phosphoribosyltransferase